MLPAVEVVPAAPGAWTAADHTVSDRTREKLSAATGAAETNRKYERWWRYVDAWCRVHQRTPLPMATDTLTELISQLTDTVSDQTKQHYAPSSLSQCVAAILWVHKRAGARPLPDDADARLLIKNHRRQLADAGRTVKRSAILTPQQVADCIAVCDHDDPAGIRDAFLCALSFSAWTRRGEFERMLIPHVVDGGDHLAVFFPYSKTDQAAKGETVHLLARDDVLCPVTWWRRWRAVLAAAGVHDGRVLRRIDRWGHIGAGLSGGSINAITKKITAKAGCAVDGYGRTVTAHGWRASGYSAASRAGAAGEAKRRHGRWSPAGGIPERVYDRVQDPVADNPMTKVVLTPPPAAP